MAPTGLTTHDIPSDDEIDDILNGVLGVEDISPAFDGQAPKDTQNQVLETINTELGLDKAVEVEQVKKRLPIPKLDDARFAYYMSILSIYTRSAHSEKGSYPRLAFLNYEGYPKSVLNSKERVTKYGQC